MPLNSPDCPNHCPFPYRVQVGDKDGLGREVKWFICCAITRLEMLTGEEFHQVMYDVEPGGPRAPSDIKPEAGWPFKQRIIAAKRAKGFKM